MGIDMSFFSYGFMPVMIAWVAGIIVKSLFHVLSRSSKI